jgi:maltooligosyltrehalose trehalohydrolase
MEWDTTDVPNPQDPETFTRSKLDWSEPLSGSHADLLALTTELLKVRRSYPDLTDPRFDHGEATADDEQGWLKVERGELVIVANFSDTPSEVAMPGPVEALVTVGQASVEGEAVKLAAHSAMTARRTDLPHH